jgi:sugar lactone lactonase YvrE
MHWLACATIAVATALTGCQPPTATIAVANYSGNSITEYPIGSAGNVTPSATLSGNKTGLSSPVGLASDSVGSLRASDSTTGAAGTIAAYVSGASGNSAPVTMFATGKVGGIALDANGNIYATSGSAADGQNHVVIYSRVANGNAIPIATIAGTDTGLLGPVAVTLDASGKIYVANFFNPPRGAAASSITIYPPGGSGDARPVATIAGPQTGITSASAIAVDSAGAIYVANVSGSVVIFPPGASGNIPPQRSISGSNTGLTGPNGIAVDAAGNIYVSNYANGGEAGSIVVFPPGANGNVAPSAIISGDKTELNGPTSLIIIPPAPDPR